MAQQPHIELDRADLPRRKVRPRPSRWTPNRPGEITKPSDVVWGGAFGRPGPDTGWALHLVRLAEFDRGNTPELIEAIVANVAAARAAKAGRGPKAGDVEVALVLLGLRPEGLPADKVAELSTGREQAIEHAAHERDKGRSFLASIPDEFLEATPGELRALLSR